MEKETNVNYVSSPSGRQAEAQVERRFRDFHARSDGFQRDLKVKLDAIKQLKTDRKQNISDATNKAYSALEKVVKELLRIENGNQPLSRQSTTILAALGDACLKFSRMSELALEETTALAVKQGDCMALGDNSSKLVKAMRIEAADHTANSVEIWNEKIKREADMTSEAIKLAGRASAVSSAQADRDSFGTGFANFFNSDAGRNAQDKVNSAQHLLNLSQAAYNTYSGLQKTYYCLSLFVRNVSAKLLLLADRLEPVAVEFDKAYKRLGKVNDRQREVYAQLVKLRYHIEKPEFQTTRNDSLDIILRLLKMDDDIFMKKAWIEKVQQRIEQSIRANLGTGDQDLLEYFSLERKKIGAPPPMDPETAKMLEGLI